MTVVQPSLSTCALVLSPVQMVMRRKRKAAHTEQLECGLKGCSDLWFCFRKMQMVARRSWKSWKAESVCLADKISITMDWWSTG